MRLSDPLLRAFAPYFVGCTAVVAALATVTRPTRRDLAFATGGFALARLLRHRFSVLRALHRLRSGTRLQFTRLREEHIISSLAALRDAVPAGPSGSHLGDAPKVLDYLDAQMVGFIARSPLVHLATVDERGQPFVSPKGDAAGFVEVLQEQGRGVALRIPDRPGNRLIFGLQNLINQPRVGLQFQIPGTATTLRCGGPAAITSDPDLLERHAARGLQPRLVVHIEVEHAFFHCSKAYLRSQLWQPSTWPDQSYRVCFGPYFFQGAKEREALDADIERHYEQVREAVAGKRAEPD